MLQLKIHMTCTLWWDKWKQQA